VLSLIVFLAFVLLLWCFAWDCLRHLLPLLAIPLLLNIEDLLVGCCGCDWPWLLLLLCVFLLFTWCCLL
jgi:hypothetical protein